VSDGRFESDSRDEEDEENGADAGRKVEGEETCEKDDGLFAGEELSGIEGSDDNSEALRIVLPDVVVSA